ncbi:hypothetical protein ACFE04_022444 [Oxalis oulophora]
METLTLLDQIHSVVSDQLQVVSYKWLSRYFSLPSNSAKRLLQDFVDKHGSGLDVVYSLSGWLKKDPSSYHILLVTGPKLAEAEEEFDGNCSVRVYSVQASIPKDPVALWNAEFLQAEELFRQPSAVDNCFRDNRFCAISNAFVKRNVVREAVSIAAPLAKSNYAVPQSQQKKSPAVAQKSPSLIRDVESENNSLKTNGRTTKPQTDKETTCSLTATGKKRQNDTTGGEGSLANLWGRASLKSKPSCSPVENNKSSPHLNVSAEAQISAREEVDNASSDDDGQNVNFKRALNGENGRKRRIVMDYSDEEENYEDAVNLSSPDSPKTKSCSESKHSMETVGIENNSLKCDDRKENEVNVKEQEKATKLESNQPPKEKLSVTKNTDANASPSEEIPSSNLESNEIRKGTIKAAPNSPKRRKVLKTRIDECGREVTEVIWEGEEMEVKKDESKSTKKTDNNVTTNVNRPPVVKKSPVVGNTAPCKANGKGGNKKAGNKDHKQGNILSFFKKV